MPHRRSRVKRGSAVAVLTPESGGQYPVNLLNSSSSARLGLGALCLFTLAAVDGASAEGTAESQLPAPAAQPIDFARDIKPVLASHCFKCHGDERPKSGFRLTSREGALKGGSHGVDIFLGKSAQSPLVHYVARLVPDLEMPPTDRGEPLTREEVALVRAWIDQGVSWEPVGQVAGAAITLSTTVGGTAVSGNEKKFRELNRQPGGVNGGLEDFEVHQKLGPETDLRVTGRLLLDDYTLTLDLRNTELGFTRFGWSQHRKYSDDTGGYYPSFSESSFSLNRDLHMDIGRAWVDFGLTLPQWPRLVLGYEHQYREGSESTLQWGAVQQGAETRNIYPSVKSTSEHVEVLKFDVDYELAGMLLQDRFRGEWYHLDAGRMNEAFQTLGSPGVAQTGVSEQQGYFQGANATHVEMQITPWLFAASGYLYSRLTSDASMEVATLDPVYLSPGTSSFGWHSHDIELERESHVFSGSSVLGPWDGLSLSAGSQSEWTRQTGFGNAGVDILLPFSPYLQALDPERFYSDLDRATFTENAGLRYTRVPFTTLFVEARFQQESIGQSEQDTGDLTPYVRDTEVTSELKDYRAGFYTSPWRRISLSGHYRHYDSETDYQNFRKDSPFGPFEGYPSFIRWRDVLTQEAAGRLSFRLTPQIKTAVDYKWVGADYRTATDSVTDPTLNLAGGISPGGGLLSGASDSHIVSLNTTWTPGRQFFLSTTLAYQNSRTVTAANGSPSVAPYRGDISTVIASASYALNTKTDFVAGYSFSMADFAQDNAAAGLPLGIEYQQHGLQVALKHRLAKGKTLGIHYRFYYYDEPSGGGFGNFQAHALFATLTWRWPP